MAPMYKPYWQVRQEKKYFAGEKKINDYYRNLKKSFEQAKHEIQSVINNFYWRFAEENQLSFESAQLKLNQMEIGELKDFIRKVYENMGKYNLELNNMSIRARITRYQALEKQIDAILQQLYAIEYQYKGEELLKEVYTDTYYRTWFNIDQYHGFHQEFAQINAKTIDELIRYPFNGADFSTRLWKQKDHLLQRLNESITTMLIQGRNPKSLVPEFAKMFGTKEYEAYRLLHTEGSFIMEQGTLAGYKEDGVEKYRILATLDIKTSDICRSEDGKIYEVEKAVTGVNYPPYHPNCRTTTVPIYEDDDLSKEKRVARDPVTGKTYEVPADMTYEEWHKKYIENNPEALLEEKKWKNRYTDLKQYERYKEVLGNDLGANSLDDFQKLKYNEAEKWKSKQREYNTISKIKSKETYSEEYRNKLIKTYYDFKKEGFEFTDHSLNRFLGQKSGKGKRTFTKDDLLKVLKSETNYIDDMDRTVKFYDDIAVIQNKKTMEVVTIVTRKYPKKGWSPIDK